MDLILNTHLGESYKSNSQKVRVITEDWVAQNMFCPRCGHKMLSHYSANKPVADFYCEQCNSDFELKSQERNHDISNKIVDGAYSTMIERINSLNNPNLLVMTYHDWRVTNFIFIPNHLFTCDVIERRKPLSPTAKRAGWVGCNILIDKIPESGKIYIVKNSLKTDIQTVMDKFKIVTGLQTNNLDARGWILDILKCIEILPEDDFCLKDVYQFEDLLHEKHPTNNFIKDKIRQQLQILRDKGFIEFTSRGNYRKLI